MGHEFKRRVEAALDRIERKLDRQNTRLHIMSAELDTLTTKVQETTTVEQSAIELLGGLSAQIASLKDDPAKLQALADSLDTKKNELAAAVAANTPSAPAPSTM